MPDTLAIKTQERFNARLLRHVRELLTLAWPVMITRAGILTMALADAIMVGRFSTQELAYLALGVAPVVTIIVTTVGLMYGTLVATANAFGKQRYTECGSVWRLSLPYGFAIGVTGAVLCTPGEMFFLFTGQTQELAAGGGVVMIVLGLGLPANLMFVASNFFLEAIKRPLPGMTAMVAVNLLNILLNWILVYGHWGSPALGAVGSAWATTFGRWVLALGLIAYIWNMRDHAEFGIRKKTIARWREWSQQRRLGFAAGASSGVESVAFASLTLFAGWLGTYPLSAYSLGMNLLALIFMTALGLGTATAIRVGIAHGRHDHRELVFAGWTGLGVSTMLMATIGLLLFFFPRLLASMYTTDIKLIATAAPLIAFTAFVMVADGGQVVISSALRGRGDTWMSTLAHAVSYVVVMMPLGWLLAIKWERGARGLYEAVLIASVLAVALLAARFQWLAKQATDTPVIEGQEVEPRMGDYH
ncbi:MAG: MATE family efflux transporter [Gammaproteobacteria bacterium]